MNQWRAVTTALALLIGAAPPLVAQPLHPAFSGGMGVTYRSPADVVAVVNSIPQALERVPQFGAGAEFFAAACFPLSESWLLKIDYAYQIASLNIMTSLETAQFTINQHCPTLILQYVLANQGMFNVKAGAGAGYHFGRLSKKLFYIDDTFTAQGPALTAEVEGNTAFGEHLFAYLGVSAGWSLVGTLKDASGRPLGVTASGEPATLNSVGVGARLGFTYYLN